MSVTIAGTAATLNRVAVTYNKTVQQTLRQGLEFEKAMTPRACDNTYSAPNASMTDVIQPYQWQFTPKGDVTFDAVENKLQKIKIDILITGDDLEKFWDSWMIEWHEIGKDPKQWSFHRYLYDVVIVPKLLEEMNTNSWAGVYAAPTPGTAGASTAAVDGYKKKIEDAILAGDVTEYATGAFVATTMVSQIESWCDSLPIPYRDQPGKILMSNTNAKAYWRDYRAKFGAGNSVLNPNDELRVDATKKQIVGLNAMEGSNRIIFSPAVTNNMIWGTRRGYATYPNIRWEGFERSIKGMAEIYRFYGFEYWNHLFVNDQA